SAGVLIAASVGILIVARNRASEWEPDWQDLARKIELQHPDLLALLRTAIEQRPDPVTGKYTFLQQRLLDNAAAECERRQVMQMVSDKVLDQNQSRAVVASLLALLFMARLGDFSTYHPTSPG